MNISSENSTPQNPTWLKVSSLLIVIGLLIGVAPIVIGVLGSVLVKDLAWAPMLILITGPIGGILVLIGVITKFVGHAKNGENVEDIESENSNQYVRSRLRLIGFWLFILSFLIPLVRISAINDFDYRLIPFILGIVLYISGHIVDWRKRRQLSHDAA